MTIAPHILVVDDDNRLRKLLGQFLRDHGFAVSTAADAKEARQAMDMFAFDAMILDVMMPGEDGISLAASLPVPRMPILMLSAKSEAEDRIFGLEAGVDDYLTKPFEPKELILRLQTILRRAGERKHPPADIQFGEYVYHPGANQLSKGGAPIHLTGMEAALLKALAECPGQPVSREALAERAEIANTRSVDVQITRLRKKIEPHDRPVYIQTVRGEGYALMVA